MKMYALGTYTSQAHAGFAANPDDDRNAAVTSMVEGAGGKVLAVEFLRGIYDFVVIIEIKDFEIAAALKLMVMSSGTVDMLHLMEVIDFNSIAKKAHDMGEAYRPPGA
jgi:uncharacterized protein with GYD domain